MFRSPFSIVVFSTSAERSGYLAREFEIVLDKELNSFFIGNGSTVGGVVAGPSAASVAALLGADEDFQDELAGNATLQNAVAGDPDLAAAVVAGIAGISPPFPKTASGVGQFVLINTSAGSAAVLPAGGNWMHFVVPYVLATGVLSGTPVASIGAGGSTVGSANTGITWVGWAWRIN